jgi:indolepyruvate ferredoxin oxidoreductase beta subunit
VDVVLAGVGGQGVLSAAAILSLSAREAGFQVRQGEVHGMSQRGGAVEAHLRIADEPVASGLIPRHRADLILSLEPLEGLRYLDYLSTDGTLVTSADPFENIPDYPELEGVLEKIRSLPRSVLVPARTLAREAGSANAVNVVMVGAASSFLPMDPCLIEEGIVALFSRKGEKVVKINLEAFRLGRSAATQALAAPARNEAGTGAGTGSRA